ncbi:hypothetical protein, partial [Burkholderia sp. 8Y]|uniref:hypothetical protein n=1 Tax=Burkholderia sp. 8Y TaxID=2653133 RepID=UPI001F30433C
CTASVLNSAVYACFGILNIDSFLPSGRVYTRPAGRRNFGGSSKRIVSRPSTSFVYSDATALVLAAVRFIEPTAPNIDITKVQQ